MTGVAPARTGAGKINACLDVKTGQKLGPHRCRRPCAKVARRGEVTFFAFTVSSKIGGRRGRLFSPNIAQGYQQLWCLSVISDILFLAAQYLSTHILLNIEEGITLSPHIAFLFDPQTLTTPFK